MNKTRKATNRNYRRGASAEYNARDLFLRCGKARRIPGIAKATSVVHPIFKHGAHNVARSAGSHGLYDLVVECPEHDIWVQVKRAATLTDGQRQIKALAKTLRQDRRPRPANRYRAGLVFVPRQGWLVAVSYLPGKVVFNAGAVYEG